MNKLQNNQSGMAHVMAIVLVVVVAAAGFAGWRIYSSQKKADESLSRANEVVKQDKKEEPEEYKPVIPDGWKTYENSEYGFSFAYPKEWGDFEPIDSGVGPDNDIYWVLNLISDNVDQRDQYGLSGNLRVSVVTPDFKEFRTVKAGTPLEYVARDEGYWIASTKVDLEFDNLKPGDKVSVPIEKEIKGTNIFRVEGNYECVQNAEWWFATTKGIVQIGMPRFNKYVGESTGVCSSTKQVGGEYWQKTYKQILNSINIF